MKELDFPLAATGNGTLPAGTFLITDLAQYPYGTSVEESDIEEGLIAGIATSSTDRPYIKDGFIFIPENTGLTGVSIVERAGVPTITTDKTLEMPLASHTSDVEAVGLLSAVDVVAPYGVDAGGAREVTLERGTLRIPRAHAVYGVDEQTTGLIAGIREKDEGVSGVEIRDGIIYIPKGGAAGVQQVSNGTMSYVEPTIEGSTLFLPFAATSSVDSTVDGEVNPRVGLVSGVEYHSAVEIPEIHNGTIRLPLPRGTKGIAYGVEDATGWKNSTAAWSAVEMSYVEAAACDLTFGSAYARLVMEVCTQNGFLNIRLRTT